jgi:hypothetical protein
MSNGRQWQFTVTDYHRETWPREGIKVGLQITDGERILYRSTVLADARVRGLSHDEVVRLAWEDLKGEVGVADIEGRRFVVGADGSVQPVVARTVGLFEIDTSNELERLRGEILNDALVFDGRGSQYTLQPAVIRYYTNLEARYGQYGFGTIDLTSGTSLPRVQLVTDLRVRDGSGAEFDRSAKEIVRISVAN